MDRRSVLAVGIGNGLEFYDFAIFASLAPDISRLFFPSGNALASILSTFAVYAVGFFMRPLGAIFFGRLADRGGRKIAMVVVVTIMGAATIVVGLMPTYGTIGVWAPVLLVLARIVQGLAVGGEFGTSATYLIEQAPRGKRGLYGAFAFFYSTAGSVLGVFVVFILTLSLTPSGLESWGWRIPFLLGLPLLLLGSYLRYNVAESSEFEEIKAEVSRDANPVRSVFTGYWRAFLAVIGVVLGFATASATVQAFMPSYIETVVGLSANRALGAVLIASTVAVLMVLGFGYLSDRVGARSILVLASALTVALPYPSLLVVDLGGFGSALAGLLMIWVPVAAFGGATPTVWADMFPTRIRVSGFGIAYAVGTAAFAGSAPFVATWLIEGTGSEISPAWYMAAGGVVTLAVVVTSVAGTRKRDPAAEGSVNERARPAGCLTDAETAGSGS